MDSQWGEQKLKDKLTVGIHIFVRFSHYYDHSEFNISRFNNNNDEKTPKVVGF